MPVTHEFKKRKLMKNKLKFTVLLLSMILLSLSAHSQLLSRKGIVLDCKHLSPIQQAYLARHINYRAETKNLESKTVEQFIKKLDPSKVYLLKSDIKKIKKDAKSIFAKIKRRECKVIKDARKLYVKRVTDRIAFVKKHLQKGFKFNKKTELTLDPDKRSFAKNINAAQAYHKKYLQFQIANYVSTGKTVKEAKEKVIKNYDRLLKRINNFRQDDLWTMYLNAYATSLDPHSSYFSKEMLEDFQIQMKLSLEGIGATLSSKDGFTTIEQLVPGGAAFRSGKLQTKDKIIAVGQGKTGAVDNVIEMELRDVVRKIRGKKGTIVRLSILRETGKKAERFIVKLVRDKINLEDDAASITYIDRKVGEKTEKVAGKMKKVPIMKKVGLIHLPSFYADGSRKGRTASKDIKKLIKEAKNKNVAGLVLDLSSNGGGSLDDAVKIAGLFFKVGNVVKQSHRDPAHGEIALADEDKAVDYSGPLVVLTSKLSASASEIVSGTLKDYKRALIVGGKKTFGKGSVQSVEQLPTGLGALKTTVGMFFTAGGASTQHIGVAADIVLPSVYDISEIGEDTLDYSLPPKKIKSFLTPEAYVASGKGKWKKVEAPLINKLKEKSKKRVAKSEDFAKILKDLKKAKKKNKVLKVSEILEDKSEDDEEEKGKDGKKKKPTTDPVALKKEKKEKYMKRADIQESLNILFDFIKYDKDGLKITAAN